MWVCEQITFRGHRDVRATHKTTFEITKSRYLTRRGDCIIGVGADKACADLNQRVKEALRRKSLVRITLSVSGLSFRMSAEGSPDLMLTHKEDIVVRRSGYICPRTLAIRADAAAADIPRDIIEILKSQESRGYLLLEVEVL